MNRYTFITTGRPIRWLHARLDRFMTARNLLRQECRQFKSDYRTFFHAGESKGQDIGQPFLLKGTSRELGVVLVHGFTAAPREMKGLADYLHRHGVWVYAVRLKGHGTSPDDLARCCTEEWRESVDNGYAIMKQLCARVIVGGFSFGGGLALDCAARHDEVAGVFAVSPPMRLQNFSARFAPSVAVWNRFMNLINIQAGKLEFVQTAPEHPDVNYSRLPIAGLVELEHFMKGLAQRLAGMCAPALIVQSLGDPVVHPSGTKQLFEQIGSKLKYYRTFDYKRHGILSGSGAEQVHEVIFDFVRNVRSGQE